MADFGLNEAYNNLARMKYQKVASKNAGWNALAGIVPQAINTIYKGMNIKKMLDSGDYEYGLNEDGDMVLQKISPYKKLLAQKGTTSNILNTNTQGVSPSNTSVSGIINTEYGPMQIDPYNEKISPVSVSDQLKMQEAQQQQGLQNQIKDLAQTRAVAPQLEAKYGNAYDQANQFENKYKNIFPKESRMTPTHQKIAEGMEKVRGAEQEWNALQPQLEDKQRMAWNTPMSSKGTPTGMKVKGITVDEKGNQKVEYEPEPTNTPSPYRAERIMRTEQKLLDIKDQISEWTTGPAGYLLRNIPGTPALALREDIKTLESSIVTSELTAMREASKTGGAFGQFSDQEGQLLKASLASLNQAQNPKDVLKSVNEIEAIVKRWKSEASKNGFDWSKYNQEQNTEQNNGVNKKQGQLMIDANGNKAIVYSDGSYDEV